MLVDHGGLLQHLYCYSGKLITDMNQEKKPSQPKPTAKLLFVARLHFLCNLFSNHLTEHCTKTYTHKCKEAAVVGDGTRKLNSELQTKILLTGLLQAVLLTCGLLWCTALLFSHPHCCTGIAARAILPHACFSFGLWCMPVTRMEAAIVLNFWLRKRNVIVCLTFFHLPEELCYDH